VVIAIVPEHVCDWTFMMCVIVLEQMCVIATSIAKRLYQPYGTERIACVMDECEYSGKLIATCLRDC